MTHCPVKRHIFEVDDAAVESRRVRQQNSVCGDHLLPESKDRPMMSSAPSTKLRTIEAHFTVCELHDVKIEPPAAKLHIIEMDPAVLELGIVRDVNGAPSHECRASERDHELVARRLRATERRVVEGYLAAGELGVPESDNTTDERRIAEEDLAVFEHRATKGSGLVHTES